MSGGTIKQHRSRLSKVVVKRGPGYREDQVVAFILRHYAAHARVPTHREIMLGVGLNSKGEVQRIIRRLRDRGAAYARFAQCASLLPAKTVINGCPT